MPTAAVNLDTTQYVLVSGAGIPLLLQAHRDSVRIAISAVKPSKSNTVFHQLDGGDAPLFLASPDANIVTPPYGAMRAQAAFTGVTDNQDLHSKTWMGPFPEYTDFGFMAARSSAGSSSVSVDFEILLVDN